MPARLTLAQWIKKAEDIHGKGTYDYSKVNYKNGESIVRIKCNKCGKYFDQRARCHLLGKGCRDCSIKEGHDKLKQQGRERWYKRIKDEWGDQFDFTQAYEDYKDTESLVTVKCNECGTVFKIEAGNLYAQKYPCPTCLEKHFHKMRYTTADFINLAEKVHGKGEYDYSKVDYKGIDVPVLIIDPKRNNEEFWQRPRTHLQGKGNPNRRQSEGEVLVSRWLRENSIEFSSEVTVRNIEGRKGAESLVRIDFCLVYNEKTYWIEYNGEQHYKFKRDILIGRRKTPEEQLEHFNQQVSRDKNVKNYCQQNSIIFIEIPYTYDSYNKISEVLSKIILNGLKPDEVLIIPEIDYELTEQQKEKYGTVNNQVEEENNETQNTESNDDNS